MAIDGTSSVSGWQKSTSSRQRSSFSRRSLPKLNDQNHKYERKFPSRDLTFSMPASQNKKAPQKVEDHTFPSVFTDCSWVITPEPELEQHLNEPRNKSRVSCENDPHSKNTLHMGRALKQQAFILRKNTTGIPDRGSSFMEATPTSSNPPKTAQGNTELLDCTIDNSRPTFLITYSMLTTTSAKEARIVRLGKPN